MLNKRVFAMGAAGGVAVFAMGAVGGVALGLLVWQVWGQVPRSGKEAFQETFHRKVSTVSITVVDAGGGPVAADVSVWRDGVSGDPAFFSGVQSLTFQVQVGELTTVLVEAPGYEDWELQLREIRPARLSGPVRLQRLQP